MPTNITHKKCCAVLTRGPNKGKQCPHNVKYGCIYCISHIRVYGYIKSY